MVPWVEALAYSLMTRVESLDPTRWCEKTDYWELSSAVHMYACTHAHTHACMNTHIHALIHTYACMNTHLYTHMHT